MEDSRIVDLYWARDEQAIDATAKNTVGIAIALHLTFFQTMRMPTKA